MAEPLSLHSAFALIQQCAPTWPVVSVPLRHATGCVLAEDIRADRDWPPFNRSMVDGYAVRADDVKSPPADLRVIEEVAAGHGSTKTLCAGEAIRIWTGAPAPSGADAIVMQERTETPGPGHVRVLASVRVGQNISKQAEDVRAGGVVVPAGTLLNARQIGILAFAGCHRVPVRDKPRVAVLATGDELVEPHQTPEPSQIRNSNSYQLLAQCAANRWDVTYLGIARDDHDETRRLIDQGLEHDLFIATGGVSVGERDYVGRVLREAGVSVAFDKVAIKPGKPTTFGVKGSTVAFGLPGNPVAAFVCFHIFVETAVRKAMGSRVIVPAMHALPLHSALKSPGDRLTFRPAKLAEKDGCACVEALDWHGSGHLAALNATNALIVQDADAACEAGSTVKVVLL